MFPHKRLPGIWLTLLVCAGLPALAETSELRTERIDRGSRSSATTIEDSITGYEIVDYLLGAEAGQTMIVNMTSDSGANYFNIMAPGENEVAFFIGSIEGNSYIGRLPQSGDYRIRVYQMRSAARRGQTARYALDVQIAAPDFADSLSGGPDFWEVAGLDTSSRLNLRLAPSTSARIIASLGAGTILRNQGCLISEGRRWCAVQGAKDSAVKGWVAGKYLAESSSLGEEIGDILVPGTEFDATGVFPCARNKGQPMGSCEFGVVRQGNGDGYVNVVWPDGGHRIIFFEAGSPVTFDANEAEQDVNMTVRKELDLFMIRIGEQRFEIPEAVIFGG